MRSLWRHPDFARLWLGQTISEMGSLLFALPLLAITSLRATPAQMGLLETLRSLPALLFGLLAGLWIDRVRRRPVLIAADLGRALLLGSVPLLAALGWLRMEHLYAVAFLTGTCTLFFEIAHPSYLPALVRREQLLEANSKLSASSSVVEIASPAVGGLLVQFLGAPLAVLLDALSFGASALFLGRIRTAEAAPPQPAQPARLGRDLGASLRLVVDHPVRRALAGALATRALFGGFFAALYSLFALQELGLPPALLGLLVGAGGAGALLGSLLIGRVTRRFGMGPALTAALIAADALTLLIPLAGGPTWLAVGLLLAGQVLGDLALVMAFVAELSLRQSVTPDAMLGRVNAGMQFLVSGAQTAGMLAGGLIGQALGVRPALAVAALGIQLAGLWVLLSPVRSLRQAQGTPGDPAEGTTDPR